MIGCPICQWAHKDSVEGLWSRETQRHRRKAIDHHNSGETLNEATGIHHTSKGATLTTIKHVGSASWRGAGPVFPCTPRGTCDADGVEENPSVVLSITPRIQHIKERTPAIRSRDPWGDHELTITVEGEGLDPWSCQHLHLQPREPLCKHVLLESGCVGKWTHTGVRSVTFLLGLLGGWLRFKFVFKKCSYEMKRKITNDIH